MTLDDIERELVGLADDCCCCWRGDETDEKLRALARRIAVQIETDKLARAA